MTEKSDESRQSGPFAELRRVRKESHKSQTQLGRSIGCSRWQVAAYERGRHALSYAVQVFRDWLEACGEDPKGFLSQLFYARASLPLHMSDCQVCQEMVARVASDSWSCAHTMGAIEQLPDDITGEELVAMRALLVNMRLRKPATVTAEEAPRRRHNDQARRPTS